MFYFNARDIQEQWFTGVEAAVLRCFSKYVFKNFAILTVKHPCWSLFLNKVTGLEAYIIIKKRLQHTCFPVNTAKFLRATFYIEHLLWILLQVSYKKNSKNF